MPLDRRVEIQRNDGERNARGEFVDDWQVAATAWAERRGAGSSDQVSTAGLIVLEVVTFTTRWTAELAGLDISLTRIVDDEGDTWNVEVIQESDVRRRFLVFQCVRAAN